MARSTKAGYGTTDNLGSFTHIWGGPSAAMFQEDGPQGPANSAVYRMKWMMKITNDLPHTRVLRFFAAMHMATGASVRLGLDVEIHIWNCLAHEA